jgi:hypothetical protein
MEIRQAYCSATDRNIRVLLKPGAELGDPPGVGDCGALMCLEYGVTCTGAFCPLFDVPVLPEDALLASRARSAAPGPRPPIRSRARKLDA